MRSIAIFLILLVADVLPDAAGLEFYPIANPDSTYVNGTNLMPVAAIGDGNSVNSVTNGTQTVTFDATLVKYTVGIDWQTWGSPPETESATPAVLYHETVSSLRLDLSLPSKTFGFELQGADFVESPFLVRFYDGATEVGSIERTINGDAGARLFAGYSTTNSVSHVVISNPGGNSAGWALANIRYSTSAVPEPSTYVLGMLSIVTFAMIIRRKRTKTFQPNATKTASLV